jgi:hypothetical protein
VGILYGKSLNLGRIIVFQEEETGKGKILKELVTDNVEHIGQSSERQLPSETLIHAVDSGKPGTRESHGR